MNISIKKNEKIKNILDLLIQTETLGTTLELTKCVNHCRFCENKTQLEYMHPEYQKKRFFLQQ